MIAKGLRTKPLDLDAIRARADKATPGPWRSDIPCVLACDPRQTIVAEITGAPSNPETVADADFIAHARADIPALLAEIERLREAQPEAHRTKEPSP